MLDAYEDQTVGPSTCLSMARVQMLASSAPGYVPPWAQTMRVQNFFPFAPRELRGPGCTLRTEEFELRRGLLAKALSHFYACNCLFFGKNVEESKSCEVRTDVGGFLLINGYFSLGE